MPRDHDHPSQGPNRETEDATDLDTRPADPTGAGTDRAADRAPGQRYRPVVAGPPRPPEGHAPAAEEGPIPRAIAALYEQAANGSIKAIRALTDGTLRALESLRAGQDGRPPATGRARVPCPHCGHRLLIDADEVPDTPGALEIHVEDLTAMFEGHPGYETGHAEGG